MKQTDIFTDADAKSIIGQEIVGIPIEKLNDVKILQELVINLWSLLDDIDTISDIVKDDTKLYRKLTESVNIKRYNTGIKSDGYKLFYDNS